MFKKIMCLLGLMWVAQPSIADPLVGIDLSGNLYQIDDTTGIQTFIRNIGLTNTATLGYSPSLSRFLTISNGNLYVFPLASGAPVLFRTLPFLTGSQIHSFGVDPSGICWAIDSATSNLYNFGAVNGSTLVGTITGTTPLNFTDMTFGQDGSLYVMKALADGSAGLYTISRTTAVATKISGPGFSFSNAVSLSAPINFGTPGVFTSGFGELTVIPFISGNESLTGHPISMIRSTEREAQKLQVFQYDFSSINFGAVTSNTPSCLDDRDNDVLRVCKSLVPNLTVAPIQFSVQSEKFPTTTVQIGVLYKVRMANGGNYQLNLEAFNPGLGTFDPIQQFNIGLSTQFAYLPIPASTYLDANRRNLLRFKIRPIGLVPTPVYCFELDQCVGQMGT